MPLRPSRELWGRWEVACVCEIQVAGRSRPGHGLLTRLGKPGMQARVSCVSTPGPVSPTQKDSKTALAGPQRMPGAKRTGVSRF